MIKTKSKSKLLDGYEVPKIFRSKLYKKLTRKNNIRWAKYLYKQLVKYHDKG